MHSPYKYVPKKENINVYTFTSCNLPIAEIPAYLYFPNLKELRFPNVKDLEHFYTNATNHCLRYLTLTHLTALSN